MKKGFLSYFDLPHENPWICHMANTISESFEFFSPPQTISTFAWHVRFRETSAH